jgi:serine/threonine protein phosphatase PrpC
MEDAHTHILNLSSLEEDTEEELDSTSPNSKNKDDTPANTTKTTENNNDTNPSSSTSPGSSSSKTVAFFGVYDGHGGSTVAIYTGNHLHKRIANDPDFASGDYKAAIKNGFLGIDDDLRASKFFVF